MLAETDLDSWKRELVMCGDERERRETRRNCERRDRAYLCPISPFPTKKIKAQLKKFLPAKNLKTQIYL